MTSRLRLLNKLRSNTTISAAASIYNVLVVPLLSYCSLLKPTITQTSVNRILSFEQNSKKFGQKGEENNRI